MSIPQVVRLLRSRTSAGLSVLMWQLNAAAGLAWTLHGVRGGWWNIIVSNAMVALTSAMVVHMIQLDRRLPLLRAWAPVAGVAAVLAATEFFTNAAVFGVAVMIPLVLGVAGQSVDLVRSGDLSGVSTFFVAGLFAVQVMWWLWGIAAAETSIVICATMVGLVSGFNLLWLTLRARGVVRAPASGV